MMTDNEILIAFHGVTQADLDELRSGETDWLQAEDSHGTLFRLWRDPESGQVLLSDNWR